MGGPTSSYTAAGIALEIIGAHKPLHPATKCFRQGGDTIEGVRVITHALILGIKNYKKEVCFTCVTTVIYWKFQT
jgi:hypothetical protein